MNGLTCASNSADVKDFGAPNTIQGSISGCPAALGPVTVDTPVGGEVPATLSLTLGPAVTFGNLVPAVAATYTASTTANVISTAGDALLSVADPSSTNTGHLVNGAFFLPQPLQARARNAANTGTAYNNVGSSASPLNLLTWNAPISNDRADAGVQSARQRERRAPYGHVLEDPDVHAEHDSAVGLCQPRSAARTSRGAPLSTV